MIVLRYMILNLLFLKPVRKFDDVYGFCVDPNNYNNVWYWSVDEYKDYVKRNNMQKPSHQKYTSMDGIEEICYLVKT